MKSTKRNIKLILYFNTKALKYRNTHNNPKVELTLLGPPNNRMN